MENENNNSNNNCVNGKNKKKEAWRFFKYLMFTCSAGIIQFGTTTLLNEVAKVDYWIAYLVGLVLSVVWNFTFNQKFTFKSANNIPIAMAKVAAYYVVFTPLSTLWSNALTGIGWNEYIVLAGTMIINFATEYLFCRFVVFGKSIDTQKSKKEQDLEIAKLQVEENVTQMPNQDAEAIPAILKSDLDENKDKNKDEVV